MMSVKEAAAYCCVCSGLVRAWVASGRLPHLRVGMPNKRGKILIQRDDLDALLAQFKVGASVPEQPKPLPPTPPAFKLKHLKLS